MQRSELDWHNLRKVNQQCTRTSLVALSTVPGKERGRLCVKDFLFPAQNYQANFLAPPLPSPPFPSFHGSIRVQRGRYGMTSLFIFQGTDYLRTYHSTHIVPAR